jgi:hypothetical protein
LPIILPGQTLATWLNPFPSFLTGFDNGNQQERTAHPLMYDFFRPFNDPNNPPIAPDNRPLIDDRAFSAFEMKALLHGGLVADATATGPYGAAPIMAANAMKSQLGGLLPYNFNDPLDIAGSLRRRGLVTTLTMDVNQPGMSPWMWQDATGNNAAVPPVYVGTQVRGNSRPGDDLDLVSSRVPWGNPSIFPDPTANRGNGNGIPFNSEFNVQSPAGAPMPIAQSNWRAGTNAVNVPSNLNALAALKPFLGRLDLSRPLQPFPNQINPAITRFDDITTQINTVGGSANDMRTIYMVYQDAMTDRQLMARDIYRLLRKLTGITAVQVFDPVTQAPSEADLMPRRLLAQLAVNIVDFIDADDISTPFSFYPDNEQVPPNTDGLAANNALPAAPDNPNPPQLLLSATPPVGELLRYWVFGVEMPRVVLNEVFAEYNYVKGPPATPNPVQINVWAELFCPMPQAVPATVDPTDNAIVSLAVTPTANSTPVTIAPYRVMLANTDTHPGGPLIPRLTGLGVPFAPYDNDNVLGTPDQIRQSCGTDDANNASMTAFTGTSGMYWVANGTGSLAQQKGVIGVAPQGYVIVGPGNNATGVGFSDSRQNANPPSMAIPHSIPAGTPCVPTGAMSYGVNINPTTGQWTLASTGTPINDNQTGVGVTVLLRRLANPRMPAQANPAAADFNPYVTVDYISGVTLNNYKATTPANYYSSTGKLQPYAADPNLIVPQGTAPNPIPVKGATSHTFGLPNVWGQPATVIPPYNPYSFPPAPNATPDPRYPAFDWLVHLDRALVSPIELLNVSFYHPHELTHRFIVPSPGAVLPPPAVAPNATVLPSQWKFKHTGLGPWYDEINSVTGNPIVRTGAWFDQTTRLYRFFEFAETFDRAYGISSDGAYGIDPVAARAYGVSSIGRRPGRINPNTIWDQEIFQALLDPQSSNYFSIADVTTIYDSLIASRTPGYVTAIAAGGNPLQAISRVDRPFWGMAVGNMPYNDPNFGYGQNGGGIGDTFLRPFSLAQNSLANDPTIQGHPELPRLFENPSALIGQPAGANPPQCYLPDVGLTPGGVKGHPYLRFEPLNKIYNYLTPRSNVFAVWCTMGYFEAIDDMSRPVKLGAEIGKAAGTNIRHRFFGVVDRTQMVIAPNLLSSMSGPANSLPAYLGSVAALGTTPNPNWPNVPPPTLPVLPNNPPGLQWVQLHLPANATYTYTANPAVNIIQGVTQTAGGPSVAWTITPGTVLVIDRGKRNEEWIQVVDISPTGQSLPNAVPPNPQVTAYIQAVFLRPHGYDTANGYLGGFTITQPGNPGPQPLMDVRDYFQVPVVPVSVNLNN